MYLKRSASSTTYIHSRLVASIQSSGSSPPDAPVTALRTQGIHKKPLTIQKFSSEFINLLGVAVYIEYTSSSAYALQR